MGGVAARSLIEESEDVKVGITLPKELHRKLKVEAAKRKVKMKDVVREAVENWLTPPDSKHDAEFHRQMAIAREGMKRYRNALRELAR